MLFRLYYRYSLAGHRPFLLLQRVLPARLLYILTCLIDDKNGEPRTYQWDIPFLNTFNIYKAYMIEDVYIYLPISKF